MPSYTVGFSSFASTGAAGTIVWNLPGNAALLDAVVAQAVGNIGSPSSSKTLLCKTPVGLSIPANEIVTGVSFTVYRKASKQTAGTYSNDLSICPVVGNVIQTAIELANPVLKWPLAITGASYDAGAVMALPGIAYDSGFGLAIRASMTDGDLTGSDASVDYVSVTLTTVVACPPAAMGYRPPYTFGGSL